MSLSASSSTVAKNVRPLGALLDEDLVVVTTKENIKR